MAVRISSETIDAIVAAARADPAREICGLLLGDARSVLVHRASRNVAATPAERFEIDPATLIAAHRAARHGGPAVIGHYHSHPQGRSAPSATDAAEARADGSLWLIVGADGPGLWRAVARGAVHGRFDPVAWERG